MSAPRLRFRPDDRIVIRGIPRRWVESTVSGHTFERLAQPGVFETFTNQDLAYEMTREDWSYQPGARSLESLKAIATSGVADMSAILDPEEKGDVLWRLAWCEEFIALENKHKASRSRAGLRAAIEILTPRMITREYAKRAKTGTGRTKRDKVTLRPLPSARSLLRWLITYRECKGNAIGLRRAYRRCGEKGGRFCPEVEALLKKNVDAYLDEARPTKAECHTRLKAAIAELNNERSAQGLPLLPVPSLKTVSARIAALSAFEVCAARYDVEKAKRKYAVLGRGLDVTRAGERVEMDEWELPLVTLLVDLDLWLILSPEQRAVIEKIKIWVCVALDAASRAVLGLSFSRTPRAANAIAAFRMVMEDKATYAASVEATTPWDMRCIPESLVTDAGSSFIAETFKTAVLSFLTAPQVSIAGKPQMRARIERFFSTAHSQFVARYPGRTFANIVEKGDYDPERRASATVQMVCDALTRWIVDVYHNKPHAGLGGETPRNAWNRLERTLYINPVDGPNKMRHVFGLRVERVTGRHGVVILNLNYHCDALQAWRRQHGDASVDIRVDPNDLGRVSVLLGDTWHTCACMRPGFNGVAISTWVAAAADLRRRYAMEAKVDEAVMLAAIRAIQGGVRNGVETFDLGPTRPGRDEIDRAERDLFIGFAMPTGSSEQTPLFSDAIEVTGPAVGHDAVRARKPRRKPRAAPTEVGPATDAAPADPSEGDPADDEPVSKPIILRIDYD